MPASTRKRRRRGSISQRPDGRWQVRLTRRDGRRITEYIPAGTPDGERAAEDVLARLITEELDSNTEPSRMRLSAWLAEYLAQINKGKAASTVRNRERYMADINAALGRQPLAKLTPRMCQRWANELGGAHSERSKKVQLLRAALDEAVALDYLSRNPARIVKLERQRERRKVAQAWTAEQAAQFLQANEGRAWVYLWRLALLTGARIGELLALQIDDYDPLRRTLTIQRTQKRSHGTGSRNTVGEPKTPAAFRTIPLGADAVEAIEAQLKRREQLVADAGELWDEENWLFPTGLGTFIAYDNARRAFVRDVQRAGVPKIRTHDMRVTFISLALRRGAKPEVVARIVGHSSPAITLGIYRQVYQDELDDTRSLLDSLI